MPKHPCRVAAPAAALVIALLVSGCSLQPDVSTRVQPQARSSTPAPRLAGTTLTGGHVDLAAMRGHPVVVDFWASWCGPCRLEQGELNGLVSKYQPLGVRFLGVDIRDDRANALAYVHQYGVAYPSVFDDTLDAAQSFTVAGPPTTFVIDGGGSIRLTELGDLRDVPATLDSMLGHP